MFATHGSKQAAVHNTLELSFGNLAHAWVKDVKFDHVFSTKRLYSTRLTWIPVE